MRTDVSTVRPMRHEQEAGGSAQINVGRAVLQDLDLVETLAELQDHVERLTLCILDIQIQELPMRLWWYTIGVPSHQIWLLCMIAHTMTCYHEQHQYTWIFSTYFFEFFGSDDQFLSWTQTICKNLYTTIYLTFIFLL